MILNSEAVGRRLNSDRNIANRSKSFPGNNGNTRMNAMSLFGLGKNKTRVEDLPEIKEIDNAITEVLTPVETSFVNPFAKAEVKDEDKASGREAIETADDLDRALEVLDINAKALAVPVEETEIIPEENQISSDDILDNADAKIRLGVAHDKSLGLVTATLDRLRSEIDNIHVSKLPSVLSAAAKVVEGIRKERNESAKTKGQDVHYHFYTPVQRKIESYQVIEVEAR